MSTAATSSRRLQRRLGGLALYSLIWALPAASLALLLLELGNYKSMPVVFATVFVLVAVAIHALCSRMASRLFPLSDAARICLNDTLSTAQKAERLQQDAKVWRSMLTNIALLSLLVIAVLSMK